MRQVRDEWREAQATPARLARSVAESNARTSARERKACSAIEPAPSSESGSHGAIDFVDLTGLTANTSAGHGLSEGTLVTSGAGHTEDEGGFGSGHQQVRDNVERHIEGKPVCRTQVVTSHIMHTGAGRHRGEVPRQTDGVTKLPMVGVVQRNATTLGRRHPTLVTGWIATSIRRGTRLTTVTDTGPPTNASLCMSVPPTLFSSRTLRLSTRTYRLPTDATQSSSSAHTTSRMAETVPRPPAKKRFIHRKQIHTTGASCSSSTVS